MTINLRVWVGELEVTNYPYLLEYGMDLGIAANVYTVLESLLADGEVVSSDRTSNREGFVLPVMIEAADLQELADAEAALIAECDKALNTVTIDPGDGFGPPSVFDTYRIQPRFARNDDEERAFLRRFSLEVPALPWARPIEPVTIGSEFVSTAVVIEDECEATTGWAAAFGATAFSVDSTAPNHVSGTGSVKAVMGYTTYYGNNNTSSDTFTRTGLSIDASGGGYLTLAIKAEWGSFDVSNAKITTSGGGTESVSALVGQALDNGFIQYSFAVPNASTVTGLEFYLSQGKDNPGPLSDPAIWVDAIGLADAATSNQQARSLYIEGSMRTEASFAISAPAGLGDVVLYSCPDRDDGFNPALSGWQTAGTTTSDVAAVTGAYRTAGTGATFKAPASMYRPGAYGVLARIDDGGSITLSAQVELDGSLIGDVYTVTSPLVSVTSYTVIRVGVLDLPPWAVDPASGALVKFVLSGTGKVDEIMVFPLEDAALTWVSCGAGSPSATVASRLWLDEPSAANGGRPRRYVGNDVDRLDARYVRPTSSGRHILHPGRNFVYLLSSAAGGAAMATTYYPRAHSNNAYTPGP